MIGAFRIVQRNALVYRRVWRGSIFFSFLQPSLFLFAMGVGVGTLVDGGDTSMLGGVPFLHFLGPGLLASACMQTASFESSFPITGKMSWHRNYEAISATPMRIVDLVLGELGWMAIRLSMVAIAFTAVLTIIGIPRSPLVLLAIPAAVLTGLAFSAPIIGYAAWNRSPSGFNGMFRFVITPLFLFSGVFFPRHAVARGVWEVRLVHAVVPRCRAGARSDLEHARVAGMAHPRRLPAGHDCAWPNWLARCVPPEARTMRTLK